MPLVAFGIGEPPTDQRAFGGLSSLGERLERGAIPSYVHTSNLRANRHAVNAADSDPIRSDTVAVYAKQPTKGEDMPTRARMTVSTAKGGRMDAEPRWRPGSSV